MLKNGLVQIFTYEQITPLIYLKSAGPASKSFQQPAFFRKILTRDRGEGHPGCLHAIKQ
jgi:hypothetical protein